MEINGKDFSFEKIKNFDKHINSSIIGLSNLDDIIISLSSFFIRKNTNVYDLGCSSGRMLRYLRANTRLEDVSFVGYDLSQNLLPENSTVIGYYKRDITDPKIKFFNTRLILSVFTLQFLSIDDRIKVVNKCYNSLSKGGAMIICEKILSETGKVGEVLSFSHYDYKSNSFSYKEIFEKQKVLRSIMEPRTDKQNIKMFKEAGFSEIATFWQTLNFKGYLLIK